MPARRGPARTADQLLADLMEAVRRLQAQMASVPLGLFTGQYATLAQVDAAIPDSDDGERLAWVAMGAAT